MQVEISKNSAFLFCIVLKWQFILWTLCAKSDRRL